jgi:hypothetical protein
MTEIEKFISDNQDMRVEVYPGMSFNLRDILKENARLLNAQFKGNNVEPSGFVNIFTKKIWVVYRTLIQGSDVDTKEFKTSSLNVAKQFLLNMLRMVFISHYNRTFFGEFIDKVKEEMCWNGSAIVKRFDGQVEVVNLLNYITEPGVKDPQERRHAELFPMGYEWVMSNEKEWEKYNKESWGMVADLWEKMQLENKSEFHIVDFWTWEKMDGKVHKVCKRYIDRSVVDYESMFLDELGQYIEVDKFITPYEIECDTLSDKKRYGEKKEMFPYEQFDLFNIPGRWLGVGCGELLAHPEMMYDELFNLKRKMTMKSLIGILVHKSVPLASGGQSSISQDALARMGEGTVIRLTQNESLEQLDFDPKSADFGQMEEKIYELMLQLVGITAQGTGQTVAASTSATQIQDNRLTENKVYQYTKQRIHHGLVRLMRHGYAQDILDEITEKEMIAITGNPQEMAEMDKVLLDNAVNNYVVLFKEQNGVYPSEEEIAMLRQQVQDELKSLGNTRYPQIKKELFKEMNLYLEWNLVDESVDNKQRIDTLNAMKADQTSTKSKSKIEDELISLAGLNPAQFEKSAEELAQEEQMRQEEMMAQTGLNQPVTA